MDEFGLFIEKFRVRELLISESEYWTWSLRPVQPTIGSGILALKRYAESFSSISPEEAKDLIVAVKNLELKLKSKFNYEKLNYLMLMMVDPHLHFHVIPRYSKSILFENIQWKDEGWPGLPVLNVGEVDNKDLLKIRSLLKT